MQTVASPLTPLFVNNIDLWPMTLAYESEFILLKGQHLFLVWFKCT